MIKHNWRKCCEALQMNWSGQKNCKNKMICAMKSNNTKWYQLWRNATKSNIIKNWSTRKIRLTLHEYAHYIYKWCKYTHLRLTMFMWSMGTRAIFISKAKIFELTKIWRFCLTRKLCKPSFTFANSRTNSHHYFDKLFAPKTWTRSKLGCVIPH